MARSKRPAVKTGRELVWMYRLRIMLLDVAPTVWRTVVVPETITLPKLHQSIQIAMGWTNSHLHEFRIDGKRYTDYLEDDWGPEKLIDERRVRLGSALHRVVRTFEYAYDFGDGWHHVVILEGHEPQAPGVPATVSCLAGERACPPEDVGGAHGYDDFLEVIENARHPEHRQTLAWCGGAFDPERFDIDRVNETLRGIKV